MTNKRPDSVDYATQCTVCILFVDEDQEHRIVYERPQMQLPAGPLTSFDRIRLSQFPNDDALTTEAMKIFADMKGKNQLEASASLSRIFIARTAAAAMEMSL